MKEVFNRIFKEANFKKWFSDYKIQMVICSIVTLMIINVTFSISVFNYKYDYKFGDIVEEDIIISDDFHDIKETLKLKELVKYDVEEIFTLDQRVYAEAKEDISVFYNRVYDIRAEYEEDVEGLEKACPYILKDEFDLSEEELIYLAKVDEVNLKLSESYIYDALKGILSLGVTEYGIIQSKQSAITYFEDLEDMAPELRIIGTKIVDRNISINSTIDQEATDNEIEEKRASVDDVILPAGTIILESGSIMRNRELNIINSLNMNNQHTFEQSLPKLTMNLLVVLLLVLMNGAILFYYKNSRSKREVRAKRIVLDYSIFNFGFLLSFGSMQISPYLIPIAGVAMLISVLENAYLGIVYSLFLTLIVALGFSLSPEVIVLMVLSSVISSMLVFRVFQRGRLFVSGLFISLINVLAILAFSVMNNLELNIALENVFLGGIAGILCSIITIGSLPFWEVAFKILTPSKLLELANPSHPILKKMLLEAPGTYHHSILVANLSEAAALDIGANSLLARVGAYFHDIGKIDRPFLFSENQYDGNNPHDNLVPRVSAKVIKDHVERGIKLGKQYKLPEEIIEFIERHHGTTLVAYFYYKAKDSVTEDADIDKEAYTYLGPKPSNKEIAIVMLADSVEAAVRSLKKGDKQAIADLINKIIQGKINAGQLNNTGLTLGDIDTITKSFISNLSSAFHDRVEYPEIKEETHLNVIK